MITSVSMRAVAAALGVTLAVLNSACRCAPRAEEPAPASARRPNIVFIMADDHAAHAMSCYGSAVNTTPSIDRIAREGMRFTNAFCENSLCSPSRAAILTGMVSARNGVPDLSHPLPRDRVVFPQLLRESGEGGAAGYQSAVIGKWHLHRNPTGFDHFEVFPDQGDYFNPVMIRGGLDGKGARGRHEGYATDIVTDLSIQWLRERDREKPFVLLCWHKAPHRNWIPPRDGPYPSMFTRPIPEPATLFDDYSTRSDAARRQTMSVAKDLSAEDLKLAPPPGLSGEELVRWKYQRYMQDYLRCVASLDDNVGRLLDYLDSEGLSGNTIVVYTSDQGFFLGDHGWYDKRFMYEEALRMPLLVRWPGRVTPGSVCDRPVGNIDFAPTLLAAAGVAATAPMQGESMLPLLEGHEAAGWRTATYYRYYEPGPPHNVTPHDGVRTDRYKLIRFGAPVNAWELYDLKADPRELRNVHGLPGMENVTRELEAELRRLRVKYNGVDEEPVHVPAEAAPRA